MEKQRQIADLKKTLAQLTQENCHQKESQTPWQFHHYLRALEQEFEAVPDSCAAYTFFAKLRPELRAKVSLHATPFPSTRIDMVNTAQRYWDTMQEERGKAEKRRFPWLNPKTRGAKEEKTRTPLVPTAISFGAMSVILLSTSATSVPA